MVMRLSYLLLLRALEFFAKDWKGGHEMYLFRRGNDAFSEETKSY